MAALKALFALGAVAGVSAGDVSNPTTTIQQVGIDQLQTEVDHLDASCKNKIATCINLFDDWQCDGCEKWTKKNCGEASLTHDWWDPLWFVHALTPFCALDYIVCLSLAPMGVHTGACMAFLRSEKVVEKCENKPPPHTAAECVKHLGDMCKTWDMNHDSKHFGECKKWEKKEDFCPFWRNHDCTRYTDTIFYGWGRVSIPMAQSRCAEFLEGEGNPKDKSESICKETVGSVTGLHSHLTEYETHLSSTAINYCLFTGATANSSAAASRLLRGDSV